MFPVNIFPVNVVGGMKLLPCTETVNGVVLPGVEEANSADAGFTVTMLGGVKPMAKSLPRLLPFVINTVMAPGEAVKPTGNADSMYCPGGRSRKLNVPARSVAVVASTGPVSAKATFGTPMLVPLIPTLWSRTVPTIRKLCCGGGLKLAEA